MNKENLPPRIREQLEKKGYFDLDAEQRLAKNKACFDKLLKSSKGDITEERDALKGLRGGYH